MSEITTTLEQTLPAAPDAFSMVPTTFAEAKEFAALISASNLVPTSYKGKKEDVLVAMQMGAEVGLAPLQALQNIAVINGRPSMWGDAVLALVRTSGLCDLFDEGYDEESQTGWAVTKRRGDTHERRQEFSMADAQTAGLKGKQGPWQQHPKRMCKLRARGFLLRDVYPDVLRGFRTVEEARDLEVEVIDGPAAAPAPKASGGGSRVSETRGKMRQPRGAAKPADEVVEGEVTREAPAEQPTADGEVEGSAVDVESVLAAIKDAADEEAFVLAMDALRELPGDEQTKAVAFIRATKKRLGID